MKKQEYARPELELVKLWGDVSTQDVMIGSTGSNTPDRPGYGGDGDGGDMN